MHHIAKNALVSLVSLYLPVAAWAAPADLEEMSSSPDITVAIGTEIVFDEDAVFEDGGGQAIEALGPLVSASDLQALDIRDDGDALFALDITTTLSGAGTVGPRDVVRYNGVTYSLEFDGSANGLPAGSRIDALSHTSDGDLLLSIDVTVAFSSTHAATPFTAADEDVVRWDPADGMTWMFDGSDEGVGTSLDTDSVHFIEATQNLLLSFDGSGVIDGVGFDDEDVLEFDPGSDTWDLAVDGSASSSNWGAADLDAFHAVRSCANLGGDADTDKLCQDEDPCLSFGNTLPANDGIAGANGDRNGDGIPNECQCGDPNGTGAYEADDLFEAFNCSVDDPENQQPLCAGKILKGDANNTGKWEADDLFQIFGATNGTIDSWTLTCAVRPEGTQPLP